MWRGGWGGGGRKREFALTPVFCSLMCSAFGTARLCGMPEISRFLGIVITMYFNDHNPPHFHVRYEDYRAKVSIDTLQLLEGKLPSRVVGLVARWAELHQAELRSNWTSIAKSGTFKRIEPSREA